MTAFLAKTWRAGALGLVVVAALVQPAVADDATAYVILDAVRKPGSAAQPTWIGLSTTGAQRFVHVPAGATIVKLPPGRYTVRHIDFGELSSSGIGTLDYHPQAQPITFEASAEWVSFVGLIQLKRAVRDFKSITYISLATPDEMLSWACAVDPKILSERPVRFRLARSDYKLVQIRCEA